MSDYFVNVNSENVEILINPRILFIKCFNYLIVVNEWIIP